MSYNTHGTLRWRELYHTHTYRVPFLSVERIDLYVTRGLKTLIVRATAVEVLTRIYLAAPATQHRSQHPRTTPAWLGPIGSVVGVSAREGEGSNLLDELDPEHGGLYYTR